MPLATIDWAIILAYLAFTVAIGVACSRSASRGLTSFFAGDRSFPWWLVGISMVATTFAADTPLAVTGIVAREGLSGNWFWWSLALSHLLVVIVVARLWRRATVITDAQFIELRYDGRAAAALRGFKAFFFAIVINCITMGWVIRAAGKITHSFIDWQLLAPGLYGWMAGWWPQGITIADPGEGLSILLMSLVAVLYASMGGLRSVILTDLVQFLLAMTGAILFAIFAVGEVGGLEQLVVRLHELYPEQADQTLSLFPSEVAGGALFALVMYLSVQWWAQHSSDGGGYIAQRIGAARDEGQAQKGALLFVVVHYLVRTWPWVLVGLVAMVLYPLAPLPGQEISPDYARVLADREAAYPVLIVKLLPPGMMGLMAASLMAAFMSTIDTHVNWGSSYLVTDIYARFLRPGASERELVRASRAATVLVLIVALAVTTRVDSVKGAWEFFTALGAGMGLPHLLRWVWWRISAWSELAGLVSAAATTAILWLVAPELDYAIKLLITVGVSTLLAFATTMLAPPVTLAHLQAFHRQVQPFGFWGPVASSEAAALGSRILRHQLLLWLAAAALMLLSLAALRELFVGNRPLGAALVAAATIGWLWLGRKLSRERPAGS